MDIAALSMAMSHSSIKQDASLATMKIAMDSANGNAASVADMLGQVKAMEQSVRPYLGSSIDIRI
ncbi:YjfB family protein [Paenibacillus sp. sgz302251]|uniref:YjfB family protein n=1 Tax=Paenibacillus sp. sgz302251 TaxID=3414493 RepID=UPI003C7A25A4